MHEGAEKWWWRWWQAATVSEAVVTGRSISYISSPPLHPNPAQGAPLAAMGCVMSTALACMLCNHKCSISRLAATFAFFPPTPASYSVEVGEDGECKLSFTNEEMEYAVRTMPPTANKV